MSDTSLNLKLLMSLYKFYGEKQGELPIYFGNDISEFKQASTKNDLKKAKKNHDTGKLNYLVEQFFSNDDISLSGFGIMYKGELVKEYYRKPYSNKYRRVSYSVCKTVISLGFGIARDMGYIDFDTKVSCLFPEHNRIFMRKGMKQLTVGNLLNMTAGVDFDEIKAFFSYDWKKEFMSSDNIFPPGREFYYNSLNSYMLGACVASATKKNLMDFLNENLFSDLNISDITWDKCPMGMPRGGWGMKLSLRDMLKLGQLIQNRGVWTVDGKNKQLVSRDYIDKMTKRQVDIKGKRLVSGYGYGVWILKDNAVLMNGIFGQNVYINNDKKIVIATCGSAKELFPEGKLVENIMRFANGSFFTGEKLHLYKSLSNIKYDLFITKKIGILYIKRKLGPYLGNIYRFHDYASSVLPLMSQFMYSNFLTGIESISFDITGDELYVKIKDGRNDWKIKLGYCRGLSYEYQIININGKDMPIAASAKTMYDDEGKMFLKICITYLEEVSDKTFKIYFNEDSITVSAYETPDLLDFMNKFIGDDMLIKLKKYKKIGNMDYFIYKAKKIIHPKIIGYIDE